MNSTSIGLLGPGFDPHCYERRKQIETDGKKDKGRKRKTMSPVCTYRYMYVYMMCDKINHKVNQSFEHSTLRIVCSVVI